METNPTILLQRSCRGWLYPISDSSPDDFTKFYFSRLHDSFNHCYLFAWLARSVSQYCELLTNRPHCGFFIKRKDIACRYCLQMLHLWCKIPCIEEATKEVACAITVWIYMVLKKSLLRSSMQNILTVLCCSLGI